MSGAPRLLVLLALLPACGGEEPAPPPPAPAKAPAAGAAPRVPTSVRFTDLHGEATGFGPVNHTGDPDDKQWIAEAKGGGSILLDYDMDGDVDILFTDGNAVAREPYPEARTRLFRNEGGMRFTDVTRESGIDVTGHAFGGAAADYDADGDPDVFVGLLGRNRLLRNEGNGTFTEAAAEAGVEGGERDMTTAGCFADFDGNGWLDLYVSNYVDMAATIEISRKAGRPGKDCQWRGLKVYCGPMGLPSQADRLYLSNGPDPVTGRVTFRDATANLRDQAARPSFQCVAADFDQDGDQDVFTAVDSEPHHLWVNDGRGVFRDDGAAAGCAYNALVRTQAGMGADVGDYDHDGRLDIVVTNFSHDYHTLFRNRSLPRKGGKGLVPMFEDVSVRTGIHAATYIRLGWVSAFTDFDNDGDEDLFFSSGHVYADIDRFPETGTTYRQRNVLLENLGGEDPRFHDASGEAGPGLLVAEVHRGGAMADLDDDGDEDAVLTVLNGKAYILRNDGGSAAGWIRLTLRGKRPLDPAGALVKVEAAGLLPQWDVVKRGNSFLSGSDPRLLFGLGKAAKASRVTVTWPSGATDAFPDLDASAHWLLEEGGAAAKRLPDRAGR
jgi:hypothetical protein